MTQKEAKEQMMKIGQHVADIWGAQVEDVEIDPSGDIIVYADEYGEKFYCRITPNDWSQYAKECGVI